jgi:hypothetical protein
MKLDPINWKMVTHPMNWLVIILMLIIAGAIGHYLMSLFGQEPAKSPQSSYGSVSSGQFPGQDIVNALRPQSASTIQ